MILVIIISLPAVSTLQQAAKVLDLSHVKACNNSRSLKSFLFASQAT
jgi:hypothetical protein